MSYKCNRTLTLKCNFTKSPLISRRRCCTFFLSWALSNHYFCILKDCKDGVFMTVSIAFTLTLDSRDVAIMPDYIKHSWPCRNCVHDGTHRKYNTCLQRASLCLEIEPTFFLVGKNSKYCSIETHQSHLRRLPSLFSHKTTWRPREFIHKLYSN